MSDATRFTHEDLHDWLAGTLADRRKLALIESDLELGEKSRTIAWLDELGRSAAATSVMGTPQGLRRFMTGDVAARHMRALEAEARADEAMQAELEEAESTSSDPGDSRFTRCDVDTRAIKPIRIEFEGLFPDRPKWYRFERVVAACLLAAIGLIVAYLRSGPEKSPRNDVAGAPVRDSTPKSDPAPRPVHRPGPRREGGSTNGANPLPVAVRPQQKRAAAPSVTVAALKSDVREARRRFSNSPIVPRDDPKVSDLLRRIEASQGEFAGPDAREVGEFVLRTRQSSETMGLIVPAYFSPETAVGTNQWSRLHETAEGKHIRIIAIANVLGGPGERRIKAYAEHIDKSTSDEDENMYYRIIGYVECASRNPEDIRRDVEKWIELYPKIRGFYFHSHRASSATSRDFAEIFKLARDRIVDQMETAEPIVVSSPVGPWEEQFYEAADPDILCFDDEDPYGDQLPFWPLKHPSVSLAAIHLSNDSHKSTSMRRQIERALSSHVSWFWFGPKSVRAIPDCFEEMCDAILELNGKIRAIRADE